MSGAATAVAGAGAGASYRRSTRPAAAVTTRPITVSPDRCQVGDRAPATSPPSPAPTMPPRLNAAWKLGMTGRPSAATRSTAALLKATFSEPYAAPKNSSTAPRASAEWVSGGRATVRESSAAHQTVTR